MNFLVHELHRLIEDYSKCSSQQIKEQILIDIELLRDALLLLNIDHDLPKKL